MHKMVKMHNEEFHALSLKQSDICLFLQVTY